MSPNEGKEEGMSTSMTKVQATFVQYSPLILCIYGTLLIDLQGFCQTNFITTDNKTMKLRRCFQTVIKIIVHLSFIFTCNVWVNNVHAISSNSSPVVFEQAIDISNDTGIKEEENDELSDETLLYNCMNFAEEENSMEDLKVVNLTSDSITISWNDTSEEIADSYLIKWYENEEVIGSANEFSSNFTYTIKNLDPCTTYKVRVTPLLEELFILNREINATTCKISPSECLNVEAVPLKIDGSLHLNVSWEVPAIGRKCIKKYKISLEAIIHGKIHGVTKETTTTNVLVDHLHACTSYTVEIHAVDIEDKPGVGTEILAPPTLPKVRIPPRLVNSINMPPFTTTSTSITLNWNVMDEKNNCSIIMVESSCTYTYSLGSGYELKESSKIVMVAEEDPRNVSVVVDRLSPYTRYLCWGHIRNAAGYSFRSLLIPDITTKEAVPSAPEEFEVVNNVDFKFTWKAPQLIPGHMIKYKMTFFWEPLYPMPTACKVFRTAVVDNISPDLTSYTWNGGEGYSRYSVYIEAQTGAGWGTRSANVTFDSNLKGVPDRVTNLRYTLEPRESNEKVLEAILRWNLPCSLRGVLNSFDVRIHGFKYDLENDTRHILVEVPLQISNDDEFATNLGELQPEYYYKFEIAALIHNSSKKGAVARYWAAYPAGIPPKPKKSYMQTISLRPDKIIRTTSSVEILLPLFADSSGDIMYYAIIVTRQDSRYEPAEKRFNLDEEGWPNISTWRESMEHDFKLPYQVTEPYWSPYPNFILNYGSIKAVKFVVGNDITCKDVSLATINHLFCNGPLNPDTKYEVRMRAFTSGGYSDSPPILVETKAEISAILIVGIVLGVLLLGMILSMIIAGKIYFKRKEKKSVDEDTDHGRSGRRQSRRMTLNSLPGYSQDASSRVRRH